MNKILIILTISLLFFSSSAYPKAYDLEIKKQNYTISGKKVEAITINDVIPGPTLNWQEGEEVEVRVKNSMDEVTSIHWHGILLDGYMDGVPGLNGFEGIKPNETFTYKFKIRQSGTYWYHSHSNLQEQQGMFGAIAISPKQKNSNNKYDREYVVILSDFTHENPKVILNNLKIDPGYYNFNKRTIFNFFSDSNKNGFLNTLKDYMHWGDMRMDPTDLADVTQYIFLINGKTSEQNWTGIFNKGERIKLRFINASAMTIFDVSIPNLKMEFIEADGQPIKSTFADEFRIGAAETYDVIVEPKDNKVYTIFAESLDRTGYARGTLASNLGMVGEIPKMRPRALLTMADMKMDNVDHSQMNHDMHHDMNDMNHDMHHGINEMNTEKIRSGWQERGTPLGNKALEYSDLISLNEQKDIRKPNREIEFKLGGMMNRYIWTINGKKFPEPIKIKYGERVRLKFTNDTMMAHPIHLHGMFMQMENGQSAKWMPNKHTVLIPPAQSISMLLTADEAGEWALHCHLLFHMASGMMTSITVENKK